MSVGHMEGTPGLAPCAAPDHPDCGLRDVLERLGERWSVLTLAELTPGPRRFGELRRGIHGVSQRMLTRTLRHLERDGLVTRTVVPTVPPAVSYALTARGLSLADEIAGLADWSAHHMEAIAASRRAFDEDRLLPRA